MSLQPTNRRLLTEAAITEPGPLADAFAATGGVVDASVAAAITSGSSTQTTGDARWTKREDVTVDAGTGVFTKGDVVKVGGHAYITRADVNMAVVQGGGLNYENVVGGNTANVNTGTSNLTGAPTLTLENGNWNFILSGYDNVVNGWAVVMNGFHNKVAAGANHASIGGGSLHSVEASDYATIAGGTQHTIGSAASGAAIGGGVANTAGGSSSTVAGGNTNTASALHSSVIGGQNNVASGDASVVLGGRGNTASAFLTVAAGRGGVAVSPGMRAFGAQFTTAGDAQHGQIIVKRETTSATTLPLLCDSSIGLTIPENTTWAIKGLLVARRTDVDGENAAWEVQMLVKRDAGSTAAAVGTPALTAIAANAGNTWTLAFQVFSSGGINFNVTGEAAKTVRWLATLDIAQVQG